MSETVVKPMDDPPAAARAETALGAWWKRIWRQPEAEVSDLAFSGELLVAGVRLLLILTLLYFPAREYFAHLASYVVDESTPGFLRSEMVPLLSIAGIGLLGALIFYSTVQRNLGRSWIGFASSLFDVSLVSGVLAVFLILQTPSRALGDPVVFPAYLLAIGATTLRYDARLSLATGTLALLQYGALASWAARRGLIAGSAEGLNQVGRMALIGVMTLLAVTVVVRSRELRFLSTRDRFTGLLNRAVFDERLEREALLAAQEGYRFAVAMIDIDLFKRFNDTHGHANGDQALRQVAQTLRESCRESDIVARYGGEEFALILPGVRRDIAHSLLERIRRKVAVMPLRVTGRKGVSVTVSIGVASWPEDGTSASAVLAMADRRLYEAKEQGRDRVVGPPLPKARTLAEQGVQDLDHSWAEPMTPPDP